MCCSKPRRGTLRSRMSTTVLRRCRASSRWHDLHLVDRDERGRRHERASRGQEPIDNQPVMEAVQDRMRYLGSPCDGAGRAGAHL